MIYCRVLESLAAFDIDKLELVPFLAESWEVAENGLSMDVKLRENVTFSDGEPLTADDVVFTWKMQKDEEIADGRTIEYLRHITKVEKTGPYSVRFHFGKIFYENELRALEEYVLPKHFLEKFSKREIRENKALLLGSGPYKLRDPMDYSPDKPIELVRNERYWGSKVSLGSHDLADHRKGVSGILGVPKQGDRYFSSDAEAAFKHEEGSAHHRSQPTLRVHACA